MMYYHPSFWPEGFIALLINILVWGLIIYLVMHLIKKMSTHGHEGCCGMHGTHEGDDEIKSNSYYLNMVKERYAKGEIDRRQFEEMKKEFAEEPNEEPTTK